MKKIKIIKDTDNLNHAITSDLIEIPHSVGVRHIIFLKHKIYKNWSEENWSIKQISTYPQNQYPASPGF